MILIPTLFKVILKILNLNFLNLYEMLFIIILNLNFGFNYNFRKKISILIP